MARKIKSLRPKTKKLGGETTKERKNKLGKMTNEINGLHPLSFERIVEGISAPTYDVDGQNHLLSYDIKVDGMTQSMLTTHRRCPTMARLKMLGLYKPGASLALAFGSIFHQGLDYAYNGVKNGAYDDADDVLHDSSNLVNRVEDFYADEYRNATADVQAHYEIAYGMTEAVLPAYFHEWREDFFGDERIEWVDIEKEWSFFHKEAGVLLRGKFDGTFRDAQGRLWLFETKTKATWNDDNLALSIERDLQVQMYLMAMEHVYGEKPVGVMYNLIRRPQLRQKKTETLPVFLQRITEDLIERPTFYFNRLRVTIDDAEREKFKERLKHELSAVKHWTMMPMERDAQNTHECVGVYGACPFLNHCSGGGYEGLHCKKSHHSELDDEPKPGETNGK